MSWYDALLVVLQRCQKPLWRCSCLLLQPPSSRPSTTWDSRWWRPAAPESRLGPSWSSWFTLWTAAAAAAQTRSERPPNASPLPPSIPLPSSSFYSSTLLHHSHQLRRVFFFLLFLFLYVNWCFFKGLSWPLRFTWHLAWVVGRFTRFVVPSSRVLCDLRGEWSFTMKVSISLLRTDSFFFFFLRTKASRITSNVCRVFQRTFLGLVLSKTQDKFCLCLPRCNALFLVTPPTCVTNSSFQQMQRSISLLNFPQMVFLPFSSPHLCQRLHGNPGVHCQPR